MLKRILLLAFCLVSLSVVVFIACDDSPVKPPDDNDDEVKIPELIQIEPVTGVPGQQITLTGKNFGKSRGSSYVLFGEVKPESGDYISWNDTTINLKIPELALTGYIKVVVVYPDTIVMSEAIYFSIGTNLQPPFISRIKPD